LGVGFRVLETPWPFASELCVLESSKPVLNRVSGRGRDPSELEIFTQFPTPLRVPEFSSFGFRVLWFGDWVPGFWFRFSDFGVRFSSLRFRVSGLGFQVSGFELRVSGFGFGVWGFGF